MRANLHSIVLLRDNPNTLKELKAGGAKTVLSYDWEKTIDIISKLFRQPSNSEPAQPLWKDIEQAGLTYEARIALRLYTRVFGLDSHIEFLSAERSYTTAEVASQTVVGHVAKIDGWAHNPGVGSARAIRVTIGNEQWTTRTFARCARHDVDRAKGYENSGAGFTVVVGPNQKNNASEIKIKAEAQFTSEWHELAAPKSDRVDTFGYVEQIQLIKLVKINIPESVLAHREGFVLCMMTHRSLPEVVIKNGAEFKLVNTSCFGENTFGSIYEIDDLLILETAIKNKHVIIGIPQSNSDIHILFRRGYRV